MGRERRSRRSRRTSSSGSTGSTNLTSKMCRLLTAVSGVYLVYDLADIVLVVRALRTELESWVMSCLLLLGDGTDSEAREVHENEMAFCDAVIIYYGTAREHWVRMKQFDLRKAPGWGRTEPFRAAAVWIDERATPDKEEYTSADAMVIARRTVRRRRH